MDIDDEFHEKSSEVYDELLEAGCEIWVSSYILLETISLAHRRLGFQPVQELLDSVDVVATTVWVDETLHAATRTEFVARLGRRLSFVDCSTLLIARSLGATVFAFDSDFLLEGLPVVP
jgi:predicted nucleic acid-binding protein